MNDPLVWTVREAAGRIRMSESYVWNLIAAGDIKAVKIGRSTRIPESELQRFIASLTPVK